MGSRAKKHSEQTSIHVRTIRSQTNVAADGLPGRIRCGLSRGAMGQSPQRRLNDVVGSFWRQGGSRSPPVRTMARVAVSDLDSMALGRRVRVWRLRVRGRAAAVFSGMTLSRTRRSPRCRKYEYVYIAMIWSSRSCAAAGRLLWTFGTLGGAAEEGAIPGHLQTFKAKFFRALAHPVRIRISKRSSAAIAPSGASTSPRTRSARGVTTTRRPP